MHYSLMGKMRLPFVQRHPLRQVWQYIVCLFFKSLLLFWFKIPKTMLYPLTEWNASVLGDCSIVNWSSIIDICYHLFHCRIFNAFNSFFQWGVASLDGDNCSYLCPPYRNILINWFNKHTISPIIFTLFFSLLCKNYQYEE